MKRRSKRLETSESDNDSGGKDAINLKRASRRQQRGQRNPQSGNTKIKEDKPWPDTKVLVRNVREKPERWFEVTDEGLDHSDDDRLSVTCSIESGPSFPAKFSVAKPLTFCPNCNNLYQRAKRMKAPLKDKNIDNNPKSLTCDQWVLLKPWSRKTVPDRRRNLSQLINLQCLGKNARGTAELAVEEMCSRQHVFLLRNLRHSKKPQKKGTRKNWRKRGRAKEDSPDPRVVKQQCLLSNSRQPVSSDLSGDTSPPPDGNGFSHRSPRPTSTHSSASPESGEDTDLTLRPHASESDSVMVCPKHSVPKRTVGFKDLLAQLRGNSSMIVRESVAEVTQ